MAGPSFLQRLIDLQNRIAAVPADGVQPNGRIAFSFTPEDVALLSYGLGMCSGPHLIDPRVALHEALDSLLAQYLVAHGRALPSTTTAMDLLQWSHARLGERPSGGQL